MIHRVVLGSIERFIGVITEHFAGAFPVWLAPVQAKVMPISGYFDEYAIKVTKALEDAGIRVESDLRNEKIGYRVREAQLSKVPYMLIVGADEQEAGTVSVRARKEGEGGVMTIDEFIAKVKNETATFKL